MVGVGRGLGMVWASLFCTSDSLRTCPGPYLGNYDRDGRRVGRAEAHAPAARL